MASPFISVVIPTYNASKFLREALDSLIAQTFTDWEAICVNDGSTDDSLSILQEYAAKDSRFRVLDGPNGGYGKAMNRGMDAACGKYMAIFEPDDILPSRAYADLSQAAHTQQTDIVRGTCCNFFETDKGREYHYASTSMPQKVVFSALEHILYFYQAPRIWTAIYNLAFLRDKEIRFHESPGAAYQDTGFFFLSAAHATRIYCIDAMVYLYRTDNPASSVHKRHKQPYIITKEYHYICETLERAPMQWRQLRATYHESFWIAHCWMASSISPEESADFFRHLRTELQAIHAYGFITFSPERQKAIEDFLAGKDWLTCVSPPPKTKSISLFGITLASRLRTEQGKRYTFFGALRIDAREEERLHIYDDRLHFYKREKPSYYLGKICIFRRS